MLLAKLGLDTPHDRRHGDRASALRDAGMEVIYSGLKQTPEMVVRTAIQEDVDVVGLSSLSAAHMTHFPRVVELLRAQGAGDKLVIARRRDPRGGRREAARDGRRAGSSRWAPRTDEIIEFIERWWSARDRVSERARDAAARVRAGDDRERSRARSAGSKTATRSGARVLREALPEDAAARTWRRRHGSRRAPASRRWSTR